ncbi:agmatinase [Flavobacteriaceae bacterium MAR_2010_188]|nr:agmatinase [Flavobacteriaceae bacterium MAR_2010_188]
MSRTNDIIVQGLLWDEKSSFARGPALAPPLIRKALNSGSMNLFSEKGISVDRDKIKDLGDFNITDYFDIEKITQENLKQGSKLLSLGGDHSITYPLIKALSNQYETIDILHFDAHADLYDEYEGDKYSHACPFARIMESGHVNRLVQIGVRTLNPHQREQAEKFNVEICAAAASNFFSIEPFATPLYISLDLDAFDPAFAPGVSHLESGGLTPREVISIIQKLKANVIGADIVEFNPNNDVNNLTAYLAAKLYKELIAKMV